VVGKLDRLSRSVADFGRLVERSQQEGWGIAVLDIGIDTSTINGELVANLLVSIARWERRMIGKRTKEALEEARANGVHTGRRAMIPDDVVRRMRRRRKAGWTLQRIADALEDEGVPTAHGGERWRPSSVAAVLHRSAKQKEATGASRRLVPRPGRLARAPSRRHGRDPAALVQGARGRRRPLRCARGDARRARQSEHLGEKLPPIPTGRSCYQGPDAPLCFAELLAQGPEGRQKIPTRALGSQPCYTKRRLLPSARRRGVLLLYPLHKNVSLGESLPPTLADASRAPGKTGFGWRALDACDTVATRRRWYEALEDLGGV
jgi:Resolvase, N terminal domain